MPKKKTGRPPLPAEAKRTEIVVSRWTPAEAAALDEVAAELAPGAPDALSRADVLRALFAERVSAPRRRR